MGNEKKINSQIIKFVDDNTKELVSAYRVFQKKDGSNLVFYPVPKNANSSFKKLFVELLEIDEKFIFLDDEIPMIKKQQYDKNIIDDKNWLWSFLPPKPKFVELPNSLNAFKLAVVRDPVERFISAYNNRVLWHQDNEFQNLSIKGVISNLKQKNFKNQHFLPQTFFLGHNPDYFTKISIMPSLDGMVNYICNFFEKNIQLKSLQTNHSANPISFKDIEPFIYDLKIIYSEDYNFIKSIKSNII